MDPSSPDADIVDLELEEAVENQSVGSATPSTPHAMSKSQTKTETRTGNNLYQELSFQDSEVLGDVDEGADITGKPSRQTYVKINWVFFCSQLKKSITN
jgi:hypothetical protein